MTRKAGMFSLSALGMAFVLYTGCSTLIRIPLDFELPASQGTFEVQAGEPTQNAFLIAGASDTPNFSSGTIRLSPSAISVVPANSSGDKPRLTGQGTGQLIVTARIAGADELDTVCSGGDEYGPFTVDLDDDNVPTGIDPESFDLRKNTVTLMNSGNFTVCLEVVSPIDATVTIDKIEFTVSP